MNLCTFSEMLAILSSAKTTRIICAQMAVHGFDIL